MTVDSKVDDSAERERQVAVLETRSAVNQSPDKHRMEADSFDSVASSDDKWLMEMSSRNWASPEILIAKFFSLFFNELIKFF